LVFTDIEGSTRLLDELGVDDYREALSEHRRIVRQACARHDGYEVDYEGDAFFYAFATAPAAVAAVTEAMAGLEDGPIRIRVGIHTGEPALDPPKYVGLDVHRAARIMSAAHGGQVVLSRATLEQLSDRFELRDLGDHRFKDLAAPERIYQLGHDEHPPLRSLYRMTLPAPATPFLGRTQELGDVVSRLADPEVRLLTLTGPGGTGKTRLALQAATRSADDYPDGITWVALAPLRDPALVVPAIAAALHVPEQSGEPLLETVAGALLGAKAMLLLDNAEHLLPEAALEIAALIDACPTLRLLVTSRERFRIRAETVWPVPPMSSEDGELLFLRRAAAIGVDLDADEAVASVCRRLESLPLALELAAARTVALSPRQLLERLDRRLDLLESELDAEPRQRTLRATIDWSYELLGTEERRLYRALSMFASGCTLEAAREVAQAHPRPLQSLLDKSLLRRRETSHGPRYWMLETIREHAADELRSTGEDALVLERMLGWLGGMVGEVDEYWIDRDQIAWFTTLESERENLMQGVIECRRRGMVDAEARLVLGAFEFFDTRGPHDAIASILADLEPRDEWLAGRAVCARAFLLHRMGSSAEAVAELERAHAIARKTRDRSLEARSLALLTGLRDEWRGEVPTERSRHADRAVAVARRSGDPYAIAQALNEAGLIVASDDLERGRALVEEASRVAADIGDRRNAALFANNLVPLLLMLEQPEAALDLARRQDEELRRVGDAYSQVVLAVNIAIALVATGRPAEARNEIELSLELTSRRDDQFLIETTTVLAMAVADEDPAEAVSLWSAAEHARAKAAYPLSDEAVPYVERILEPLGARDDFAELWREGSRLGLDQALERGLRGAPSASLDAVRRLAR
jgi:predicted ATPase